MGWAHDKQERAAPARRHADQCPMQATGPGHARHRLYHGSRSRDERISQTRAHLASLCRSRSVASLTLRGVPAHETFLHVCSLHFTMQSPKNFLTCSPRKCPCGFIYTHHSERSLRCGSCGEAGGARRPAR